MVRYSVLGVLPSIILLLVSSCSSEIANAQEYVENQNNSTAEDKQSETVPWIGLGRTVNVTKGIADKLEMKEPIGVLVTKVFPESPAERAGIVEGNNWTNVEGVDVELGGDIILKADNETITDRNHFERLIRDNKTTGDNLMLTIFRDGQIKEINLTVGSKPGLLYEDASTYSNPAIVNFSSYENMDLEFEIEYPLNWEIVDYERPGHILLRSLPESTNDASREYLSIDVTDRFLGDRPIDIVNANPLLPNLKFVELPHNTTLSNSSAAKTIYTYTDNTRGEIKVLKAAVESNDKIYTIRYFAQSANFNSYFPTIEQMIDSFKIISMLPYENSDIGMRIKYPSDWNKIEELYSPRFGVDDVPSILFSPMLAENNTESLSNNIRIFSYRPENNASLSEEVNQTVDYYSGILGYPDFKLTNDIQLINLTDASAYSLDGISNSVPSYMLNYSYTDFGTVINATEILAKSKDRVYSVSYSAQEDEFSKHLPTFDKMMNFDSFQMFDVSRYEMPGTNSSGIILRYPNMVYPWEIRKIDNNSINLMQENLYVPDIKRDFILSVYPFNESLSVLAEKERGRDDHDKQNFTILNENKSYIIDTNLDGNITANKIAFSYYDKTIEEDVKGIQVYGKSSNDTFVVTFLSESTFYDDDLPTAEEIIDSLKIITPIKYTGENLTSSSHKLISEVVHPKIWNFTTAGVGLRILSTLENNSTDKFNETLDISVGAAGLRSLQDIVGADINLKKENLTNFQLIDSHNTSLSNNTAHTTIYTYKNDRYEDLYENPCQCDLKEMDVYTIKDKKIYVLRFIAELDKFSSYVPTIENIIGSIKIREKGLVDIINKSGLPLNGSPVDLAINPATNRLYVAIPETRQIQVIDSLTDRVIQNITIGAYPNAVALNQYTNKIYVASPETDMIYVIDGLTNNITAKIQAGPIVGDIAVDTNEFGGYRTLIFVTNQGDHSVSIIDDIKQRVVSTIKTEPNPFGIGIDTIKNRAYITTDPGVDVIDYSTSLAGRNISAIHYDTLYVGYIPTGIVVNSNTSRAYIANSASDTVSVIDTSLNEELYEIKVGLFPNNLVFNPNDKKIYVANTGNNTVSVIDTAKISLPAKNIPIDSIPYDTAVNPNTNIVYLANPESKTISTINASANSTVSALIFHINPPNAGHIKCDENGYEKDGYEKEIPENSYQRFAINTRCEAISNPGFAFSSWSKGGSHYNSTGNPGNYTLANLLPIITESIFGSSINSSKGNFTVEQYGTYSADFFSLSAVIQIISPYISIGTLLLVVLLAVIKPSLHMRRKTKREKVEKSEKMIQATSIMRVSEVDEKEKLEVKNNVDDSKLLSRGEILTIDATVIIGVLIFLTFTEGFETSEQYQINVITASIVFPFALSAIIGVTRNEQFATRLMIAGFINLMISVILIAIMKL